METFELFFILTMLFFGPTIIAVMAFISEKRKNEKALNEALEHFLIHIFAFLKTDKETKYPREFYTKIIRLHRKDLSENEAHGYAEELLQRNLNKDQLFTYHEKYVRKFPAQKGVYRALFQSFLDIFAADKVLTVREDRFLRELSDRFVTSEKQYRQLKKRIIKRKGIIDLSEQPRKNAKHKTYAQAKQVIRNSYSVYKLLGIQEAASADEVKSAYRKLVKQWHPDRFAREHQSKIDTAEEKFQEITEAYEYIKRRRGIR